MFNNTINLEEKNIIKTETLLKETIIGSQTLTNYIFSCITFLGASGFLIVGISTYLKFNIIPFLDASKILFFPQGLVMSLYGIAGIILSLSQFLIIYWKVGEGYNEFDKQKNIMTVFRRGFPGKNSEIKISYPLTDIEAVKVEIKTELFNSQQKILICIKGKPDLPILQIKTPLKITEIEKKATEISYFLKVPIKGI